MFKWNKKGVVLFDSPKKEWSQSHYQFSVVKELDNVVRVFFTTRPKQDELGKYVTYIRYADLDKDNFFNILSYSEYPLLDLGGNGSFDEFGTMPGDIIYFNNEWLLYYTGWARLSSVPYSFSIGLAKSVDCTVFKKSFRGPIIGQSIEVPFTVGSGATILKDNIIYHFCIVGKEWKKIDSKLEHTYAIRVATSIDGVNFSFKEGFVIDQLNDYEAIAAPCVIEIDGKFHMWFSYRGSRDFRNGSDSYKIGYAYSTDLLNWVRDDSRAGITNDLTTDFDNEMICYPYVVKLKNDYYMFYNGNSFGKNGLAFAKLEIS